MSIKVAINGYGRIGRNILRALYGSNEHKSQIDIVAINDLCEPSVNAHLTKYDTTHGIFDASVELEDDLMKVNGDAIKVFAERNPENLPWGDLNVDVVLECTGFFASKEKASAHLKAGAKKVLVSAPATGADATVVYGVNQDVLKSSDVIVSNASCTTNCLAPVAKVLHDHFTIEKGLMTTVHAYTNDQVLTDIYHSDLRRARSATMSMIPTKTGAAAAVGLVLPDLNGKLDGFAIRVPTINVSVVDLTVVVSKSTTADEVNSVLKSNSDGKILCFSELPLVSADYNHSLASSTVDSLLTKVQDGNLIKVISWYDNEWGFSNRMLDTTIALVNV